MIPACRQVALVPELPHTAKQLLDQSPWHHDPDLCRPALADHHWSCSKTRLAWVWIKGSLAPMPCWVAQACCSPCHPSLRHPNACWQYSMDRTKTTKKSSGERHCKVSLNYFWMTFSKDFFKSQGHFTKYLFYESVIFIFLCCSITFPNVTE